MKNETIKYWIINNDEPLEVIIVGKYFTDENWYNSKFDYVYQMRNAQYQSSDPINCKREEIYLTKEDAELAISARNNLNKIAEAKRVIEKYEESVRVIAKAKKEGLQDIDFVMTLSDEKKDDKHVKR